MPATVIAERIGWDRSITVLREKVGAAAAAVPAAGSGGRGRRMSRAGGRRMISGSRRREIPLGHGKVAAGDEVPPVLVMASGYSRWMLGLMIPSRHAEDLVLGTWRLLQQLGGVPKQLVWDNEGGVGKFRGRGRPPALSRQFAEFRGLLGCEIVVLPPREPEHKGIVERNNDYLETLVPARPVVRLPGGLQRPDGRVDAAGQQPVQAGAGVRAGGPDRCRPGRDGAAAADRGIRAGLA